MKSVIILFSIIISSFGIFAQRTFQGTCTMEIKSSNNQENNVSFTMVMKGNKLKFEMNQPGMGVLMLSKGDGNLFTLMNESKMAVKMPIKEYTSRQIKKGGTCNYVKLNSTIDLMGYKAEGYTIKCTGSNGSPYEMTAWLTKEISYPVNEFGNPATQNLSISNSNEGFPLLIEGTLEDKSPFSMRVTKIKEFEVSEETFTIPSDYTIQTMNR